MSDYQDLCEMYGRSPGDPEFIDDLIDEFSEEEYEWFSENEDKNHFELLAEQLSSVGEILRLDVPQSARFSFLVMIHAHVVSALEGYLAGAFIHNVCNSEELTRKLVESDPEFANRKFTLREIYEQKDTLKLTVSTYLRGLIFHDLKKVVPMYRDVLGHRFEDLSWLFHAVKKRHDCVHRAGLDKDGKKIDLTVDSIFELLEKSIDLATGVERSLAELERKGL